MAAFIGLFSRKGAVKEDTAIGILFAAALALGVVLISTVRSYATDLTHILFGNVLGVSSGDLWLTGILALAVLATVVLLYKELLLASFDPVLAHTLGRRPELLRFVMLFLLAFTVVVSLQTVGVGLVAAMLVTPAATAYLLTRRLAVMMVVSAVLGRPVQRGGALPELLPERGVGRRRGAGGHGAVPRGVRGRAPPGAAGAASREAQRRLTRAAGASCVAGVKRR